MTALADRVVAAETAGFTATLVVVYWLDEIVLWIVWAVLTALFTGATLVWLNR